MQNSLLDKLQVLRGPNNSLLVCPRDGAVTSTLFWLHGLGDSAGFYWSFFYSQNTPVPPDCKVRLLTTPTIKLTINGGEYITACHVQTSNGDTQ